MIVVVAIVVVLVGASIVVTWELYEKIAAGTSDVQLPPGNWTIASSQVIPPDLVANGTAHFSIAAGVSNFVVVYWANCTSFQLNEHNQTGALFDSTGYEQSSSAAIASYLPIAAEGNWGGRLVGAWTLVWQESGSDLHLAVYTR